MAEPDLYIGKEPVTFDFEGVAVFVGPATVVRAGHPIMKGREGLFVPLVVHFEVAAEEKSSGRSKQTTAKSDED